MTRVERLTVLCLWLNMSFIMVLCSCCVQSVTYHCIVHCIVFALFYITVLCCVLQYISLYCGRVMCYVLLYCGRVVCY